MPDSGPTRQEFEKLKQELDETQKTLDEFVSRIVLVLNNVVTAVAKAKR